MEPLNHKQLSGMLQRRYSGECTNLVHNLVRQLMNENALNKTALEQTMRERSRVLEMDRRLKPIGRVLMVDLPPFEIGYDFGCVEVYSDPGVDISLVQSCVTPHDQKYDELLEQELKKLPERFKVMPWEIGPRYCSTWTRWATDRRSQNTTSCSNPLPSPT